MKGCLGHRATIGVPTIWLKKDWTGEHARCKHVFKEASDHCIIMFETNPGKRKWKKRFQLDRRWIEYKEVNDVISQAWKESKKGPDFTNCSRK